MAQSFWKISRLLHRRPSRSSLTSLREVVDDITAIGKEERKPTRLRSLAIFLPIRTIATSNQTLKLPKEFLSSMPRSTQREIRFVKVTRYRIKPRSESRCETFYRKAFD